jgi:hypothetical protein
VSTPRTAAAPPSSHPSPIFWVPSLDPLTTSCPGVAGRGAGRLGWIGVLQKDEGRARLYLGDFGGSWRIAYWKHSFLLNVTTELNNQRLGAVLLF